MIIGSLLTATLVVTALSWSSFVAVRRAGARNRGRAALAVAISRVWLVIHLAATDAAIPASGA